MAWIDMIPDTQASGLLARLYKDAIKRAGKVFNIIRIQSLLPSVLRASTRLYTEIMKADSDTITRAQREMIATTVSRINGCYY